MRLARTLVGLSLGVATLAHGQSVLSCTPDPPTTKVINGIWPLPYLSKSGELCFDVKSWNSFAGKNCVANGGEIRWAGVVIVSMDGESQGRDLTSFRVVRPTIDDDRIEYVIEWARGGQWKRMQDVKINRLTGQAISWLVTMHGGDSFRCRAERKAF